MSDGYRGTESDPGPRFLAPVGRPRAQGTDARTVLADAGLSPRLDVEMALAFLVHGEYDAYRSFASGLALAPPRCPVRPREDGTLVLERGAGPPPLELGRAEAAGRLRAAVLAATEALIRPHDRVGLWLSGGVDSSVVAAASSVAWRRLGRDPSALRAYHQLPAAGRTEVAGAREVSSKLGLQLVELPAVDGDPYAEAEAFFARLDVPSDGGGPATSLAVAGRMREDGIGLFLTGDGGDEVFGPLEAATHTDRLRRALPGPLPGWIRRRLPRRSLPAWLARAAPRRHAIHTSPAPRRGLRAARAWRDRMVRCARQTTIVAYLRAVGEVAEAEAACPLLAPTVADLCVALSPRLFTRGVPKLLALEAFAAELPPGPRPPKAMQPAMEEAFSADLARYGPGWAERWLDGGVLEGLGILPLGAGPTVLSSGAEAPYRDLIRALATLGLEIYARTRLGRPPA